MSDLDDFFAKKDRKKPKTKKFTTSEDLVKKLEDTSTAKKSDVKPRKELPANDGDDPNNLETINEDLWKDFEEQEKKDYTGLKIGQLQINEDELGLGTDGEGGDGSDGELNSENSEKRQSGPWKKVQDPATQTKDTKPVTVQPEKPPASSIYISPALRLQQQQQTQKLRKGVLPDINNQDYFPVLGAAKPEEVKPKKRDPTFEEVKHGGRVQKSSDLPTNAPVIIGNRFNSLSDS